MDGEAGLQIHVYVTSKPVVFPLHASASPEIKRNALILRELIIHGT